MSVLELSTHFVHKYEALKDKYAELEAERDKLLDGQTPGPGNGNDPELDRLKAELAKVRLELSNEHERDDTELDRLKAELAKVRLELSNQRERDGPELDHLKAELAKVRLELSNERERDHPELDRLKTELARVRLELSNQRERAEQLEAELHEATRNQPAPPTATDTQLALAQYEIVTLHERIRKLEDDNDDLRDRLH